MNTQRLGDEEDTMWDWMLASYVADATQEQWKFIAAQSRFGLDLWTAMLGNSQPVPFLSSPAEKEKSPASLEKVAAERLKEGFAPPREIYDIRNRGRIDWSGVPDWAKPVDPEIFEGGHEG
jgi:hypothetical protein